MHSLAKFCLGLVAYSLVSTFVVGGMSGWSSNGLLSLASSILIFFFAFLLIFLGFFGLSHLSASWRLGWNPWVEDVGDMDYLFNPMYWTWLFFHDHKKWAKWTMIIGLALAIFLVTVFGGMLAMVPPVRPYLPITHETFWTGWTIATILVILFAIALYLHYTSVDRTPSPYPKGPLSDLPRRL